MTDPHDLNRFVDAQQGSFERAFEEIGAGSKQSHWIWFIFPQLAGLGRSSTAQFYGIKSRAQAEAYLDHPLLGARLRQCVEALLPWAGRRSAEQIFGSIDALKLRSSLTLFDHIDPHALSAVALDGFFAGEPDQRTLALLNGHA